MPSPTSTATPSAPPSRTLLRIARLPEGITAVCERYPGVRIVTYAIEEGLSEHAYMLPGIGDFGDRYFGTDR